MKKINKRFIPIFLLLVFILGSFPVVYGQENSSSEFTLEEITVTAEKRVENLQKTPISMAVMQGEDLRNAGAVSIKDILKDIPNVSTSDLGGRGNTINIRGIGEDMPIGVGDSAVSTNLDGTYQTRPETTAFGYFDVERIEVLLGPQGTLYGRNATGGVINVVSVKPSIDKLDGYVSLELAAYKKERAEAAINVPLSDKLAGRISFISVKTNNFLTDGHGHRDVTDGTAYRLQLKYTPTDDISIGLMYNHVYKDGELLNGVTKENYDAGNYYVYTNNDNIYPYSRTKKASFYDSKISANIEFPFAVGIVTFIPSYESIETRNFEYGFGRGAAEPSFIDGANPWENNTTTGELRYANKSDAKIKWTTGLYWTKTDEPQTPNSITGVHPELPNNSKSYATKAVFGQTTYPFTDTFRVILGARYDSDQKGYFNPTFAIPDPAHPFIVVPPISKTFSFNYFDWKAGIEQDLAKDKMLYFTLATGHKPGGFNENNGVPFEMESDISGELGIKSRFMENRLQVNGDVFYYRYKNYQVVDFTDVYHPATGVTNLDAIFFNAPEARNIGAELNTIALIGDATTLNMNLAYLNNKYSAKFIVHPNNPFDAVDQNGKPMPHSPKFTLKTSVDHTFSFGDGSTLKPSVSYRWIGEQYSGIMAIPSMLTPSYSVADASLNFTSTKNWYLNIYANNILNNHYYTEVFSAGPQLRVYPGAPLQLGVVFNMKL